MQTSNLLKVSRLEYRQGVVVAALITGLTSKMASGALAREVLDPRRTVHILQWVNWS